MPELITSRGNPKIKRLDTLLRQKKAREEEGFFVLEGVRLCEDAFRAGIVPDQMWVTPEAAKRYPGLEPLIRGAGEAFFIDEALAGRVADTKATQGVFAVCGTPPIPALPDIAGGGRYLLLHEIRDPGNLGAILRTSAALGADGVVLSGCAELFAPKTLRASMGGVWRVKVAINGDMAEVARFLRDAGIRVFAAAPGREASDPEMLAGPGAKAVLIGNEGAGLPPELIAAADGIVSIPMRGESESLGAAMAAGIFLWQMVSGN